MRLIEAIAGRASARSLPRLEAWATGLLRIVAAFLLVLSSAQGKTTLLYEGNALEGPSSSGPYSRAATGRRYDPVAGVSKLTVRVVLDLDALPANAAVWMLRNGTTSVHSPTPGRSFQSVYEVSDGSTTFRRGDAIDDWYFLIRTDDHGQVAEWEIFVTRYGSDARPAYRIGSQRVAWAECGHADSSMENGNRISFACRPGRWTVVSRPEPPPAPAISQPPPRDCTTEYDVVHFGGSSNPDYLRGPDSLASYVAGGQLFVQPVRQAFVPAAMAGKWGFKAITIFVPFKDNGSAAARGYERPSDLRLIQNLVGWSGYARLNPSHVQWAAYVVERPDRPGASLPWADGKMIAGDPEALVDAPSAHVDFVYPGAPRAARRTVDRSADATGNGHMDYTKRFITYFGCHAPEDDAFPTDDIRHWFRTLGRVEWSVRYVGDIVAIPDADPEDVGYEFHPGADAGFHVDAYLPADAHRDPLAWKATLPGVGKVANELQTYCFEDGPAAAARLDPQALRPANRHDPIVACVDPRR